jgi:hypothetical protein
MDPSLAFPLLPRDRPETAHDNHATGSNSNGYSVCIRRLPSGLYVNSLLHAKLPYEAISHRVPGKTPSSPASR